MSRAKISSFALDFVASFALDFVASFALDFVASFALDFVASFAYNDDMPDTAVITHTDDHLKSLHQNVAKNLNHAGVKTEYKAVKPSHVPDERPKNLVDQSKIDTENSVPESFKSTPETAFSPLGELHEHLDYADQLVTGRSHVVDEANKFTAFKKEKEDKKMKFSNTPKSESRGPVKKFVDWLHH